MSRTKRKLKWIIKWHGNSDKRDKVIAHKAFRRKSNVLIKSEPSLIPISLREVSDVWNFNSDRRAFYSYMIHKYEVKYAYLNQAA